MSEILAGKFQGISVEQHIARTYNISQILPKTGTRVRFNVDRNGKILAKEVTLGEGNRASVAINSTKTTYNNSIVDGVPISTPCRTEIKYKIPLYENSKGFKTTWAKNTNGWEKTRTTTLWN